MKTFEEEMEFYYSYLLEMKDIVIDISNSIKARLPERLAETCRLPGYRQAIRAMFGGSKYEELMLRYERDLDWSWDTDEIMDVSRSRKLVIDTAMGEVRQMNGLHLVYAINGALVVTVGSKEYLLPKGHLMAVDINVPHGVRPGTGGAFPISCLFRRSYHDEMNFWEHGESLFNYFFTRCFSNNGQPREYIAFDTEASVWLRYWMLLLYYEFYQAGPLSSKAILTYLNQVFLLMIRNYSDEFRENNNAPDSKERMKEIVSYIYDNLAAITLAEAARHFGVHPNTLSAFVKKQTEMTFIEFVQSCRLKEAVYYMRIPGMKISDIAKVVGYNNLSFFYRLFTEEYGMSPNRYRKQLSSGVMDSEEKDAPGGAFS